MYKCSASRHDPCLAIIASSFIIVTTISFDINNSVSCTEKKNKNNSIGTDAIFPLLQVLMARASREVIVSAGALSSPKLLMLSGVGARHHLEEHKVKLMKLELQRFFDGRQKSRQMCLSF